MFFKLAFLNFRIQTSAKKLSAVWKDRPQSPMETAVFWIEHVAKHGGGHLRPSSADLPYYRLWMLDIIGILSICIVLLSYIFWKITRFFVGRMSKSKAKSKSD